MENLSSNFKTKELFIGVEDFYQTLKSGNIDPAWYISPLLIAGLEKLRAEISAPIIINSGFRTPEHNFAVGGAKNSMHLYGIAVDIYSPDVHISDLYDSAKGIEIFKGFGKAKTFLHLDVRNSLDNVEWTYD